MILFVFELHEIKVKYNRRAILEAVDERLDVVAKLKLNAEIGTIVPGDTALGVMIDGQLVPAGVDRFCFLLAGSLLQRTVVRRFRTGDLLEDLKDRRRPRGARNFFQLLLIEKKYFLFER